MTADKPTIHLAADHAGLGHKEQIEAWLKAEGFTVIDHGAHDLDPLDDFPDLIFPAAKAVSENHHQCKGIIFGGSGQGEAIIANRFPNVRAAVYYGGHHEIIKLSREHNNANVLSIGSRFISIDDAKKAVWDWLHAGFSADPKYERRNDKIDSLTKYL